MKRSRNETRILQMLYGHKSYRVNKRRASAKYPGRLRRATNKLVDLLTQRNRKGD